MNNDDTFFDSHSIADPSNTNTLPEGSCGLVSFSDSIPSHPKILRVGTLNCIVGPNDPRYPHDADVIDLCIDDATIVKHLREAPAHWWPLCGSMRRDGKPLVIHINADDFGSLAKGITRLARAYPAVHFIADPFVKGKRARWQAGVCLADEPNVWITSRGLYASEQTWPDRSEREALHFTIGEVGASKLLFASGMTPAELNARIEKPAHWLATISFLEPAQCPLILRENAADVFATMATFSTLHSQ